MICDFVFYMLILEGSKLIDLLASVSHIELECYFGAYLVRHVASTFKACFRLNDLVLVPTTLRMIVMFIRQITWKFHEIIVGTQRNVYIERGASLVVMRWVFLGKDGLAGLRKKKTVNWLSSTLSLLKTFKHLPTKLLNGTQAMNLSYTNPLYNINQCSF